MTASGIAARIKVASWPQFTAGDLAAVETVLRSGKVNYWTGEEGRRFEEEYASYTGTKHGIAVSNGTVALELALRALRVGPDDEVVTSPRTFIASASSIVLVGARPVFAEVDRESQNITAAAIERKISAKTRAIIAVHFAGWPCDMDAILALARKHNLKVIEDCAQAHGARYKGRPVGSIGDVGTFSFCQDKIMTTGGEGGMVTLHDDEQYKFAWSYKDHGKSFDMAQNRQPFASRRIHESFGTNWRLTEMQSALGRSALQRLDEWVRIRRRNAAILRSTLCEVPAVRLPEAPDDIYHSYYRFYAFIEPRALKSAWSRDRVVQELDALGVPCSAGGCGEIYLEKAFANTGRSYERLPVARELAETCLMFLVHPTLDPDAMHWIGETATRLLVSATR